jgi:NhaA family Na+:H+ antiporter
LDRLALARREALSPARRVEHALHPWVAYGIMPLFALANAGVTVGEAPLGGESTPLILGVVLGLALGKPIGIVAFSVLGAKLGICQLPRGVDARGLLVVGCVAGIGFTMALFIAALAFSDASQLAAAKIAVLVGSALAAVVGLAVGFLLLPRELAAGAALTAEEAESATEQ